MILGPQIVHVSWERRQTSLSTTKKILFLLPFLLLHVSIAFRQPPPPPDFNCFSYPSTYTLSTVYRAHLDLTSTLHLPFLTAQLHLSGVPNLEITLGAKATKLGPCAKHSAYCLDLCVMIEMGWWILNLVNVFTSKHVCPLCISCKPNLHHSPLKGNTIILRIVLYVPIHSCIWLGSLIKGMVYYRLLSGAQSPVYDCILTTKYTGLSLYQWCRLLFEHYLPFIFWNYCGTPTQMVWGRN